MRPAMLGSGDRSIPVGATTAVLARKKTDRVVLAAIPNDTPTAKLFAKLPQSLVIRETRAKLPIFPVQAAFCYAN